VAAQLEARHYPPPRKPPDSGVTAMQIVNERKSNGESNE
jgi:hypothetical protein